MDGLWYDTVARNLAIGVGSFWRPIFTPTLSVPFFADHPPLVFAIESVFFRVFGDHWWVGKLYGFATALASVALIVALWRACSLRRNAWLPVLFWIATPAVAWSFGNEMLENTMGLFQLMAASTLLGASSRPNTRRRACRTRGRAPVRRGPVQGAVAPFPIVLPVMLSALAGRGTVRGALTQVFIAAAVLAVLAWLTFQLPDARAFAERYLKVNFLPFAGRAPGSGNRPITSWLGVTDPRLAGGVATDGNRETSAPLTQASKKRRSAWRRRSSRPGSRARCRSRSARSSRASTWCRRSPSSGSGSRSWSSRGRRRWSRGSRFERR